MCYLIAKDFKKNGCYVLKTKHGKELVNLKKQLREMTMHKGIQFVTISRPSAYGEYAPYVLVNSESDFIKKVSMM